MNLTLIGVLQSGGTFASGVPSNPRTTITIQQGASVRISVYVVEPSGGQVKLNVGDVVAFAVKKRPTDTPPLISKVMTMMAQTDHAEFDIDSADTKQMDAGRYVWDVWLTRVDGEVTLRDAVIPQSPLVLEAAVVPVP